MAPRSLGTRLALAALAILLATAAAADFRQSFKKGIEAYDRQDWAAVESLMRQAVAEQPNEGDQVRIVGMRYETYLPHFYLGLALYHGGDCAGALKEWELSLAQGVVQGTPQLATLSRLRQECSSQGVAPAATPAAPVPPTPAPNLAEEVKRAEAELARAATQAVAVSEMRRDPNLAQVWLGQPTWTTRADGAGGKLATARAWLEAGRGQGDPAQVRRAAALAVEAGKDLEALRTELEARRSELRQVQARATATAPFRISEARPTSAPLPTAPPTVGATAALRPTEPVRQASVPTVQPVGRPAPPPELRSAATALFAGDYRGAAALLANVDFPEPRAAAVALLLRAASRYALYIEGGGKDERLREQANADVRACRRLDSKLSPDRAFFSPRFAEFFGEAR